MTRLTSVEVTNFRSIRGTITVPLDAPVVLIHGPNGAGKTSLLSAIELGLTGGIASLSRVGSDYMDHLVHKRASEGRIVIHGAGLPSGCQPTATLKIAKEAITGEGLLDEAASRFFAERCFLSQSALGRLLELYEDKDARKSDSRLTKFVKDILGIDDLDALIDGLHDAGDVRRFRNSVPAYAEVRETIPLLQRDVQRIEAEMEVLRAQIMALRSDLRTTAGLLSPSSEAGSQLPGAIDEILGRSYAPELQRLGTAKSTASALLGVWASLSSSDIARLRAESESDVLTRDARLEQWESSYRETYERLSNDVRSVLPQSVGSRGPALYAHVMYLRSVVKKDLDRANQVLSASNLEAENARGLGVEIKTAEGRLAQLDGQLTLYAADAGALANALSGLLPHVHSDDCPACGRDFREVSNTELYAHITGRVAQLTTSAGQLEALSSERTQVAGVLAALRRSVDAIDARRLSADQVNAEKTRIATLSELWLRIDSIEAGVVEGDRLIEEAVEARSKLQSIQSLDVQGASLRGAIHNLALSVNLPPPDEAEGTGDSLLRIQAAIGSREEEIAITIQRQRDGNIQTENLRAAVHRYSSFESDVTERKKRVDGLIEARDAADQLIHEGRELLKRAQSQRTDLVRTVFTGALNTVWKDLFVRLAPEEPFVPRFVVPTNARGPVEAVLETYYRFGERGGNPRAMLSAGNLNTAALTLFLSLHLSVKPLLPWIVIDDPVQSMDEVHVAQFAALLRALSKTQGRQIIIAVHEKQLFDYLKFELSPSAQEDRLHAIELSRSADGTTLMDYQPVVWRKDDAVAA